MSRKFYEVTVFQQKVLWLRHIHIQQILYILIFCIKVKPGARIVIQAGKELTMQTCGTELASQMLGIHGNLLKISVFGK